MLSIGLLLLLVGVRPNPPAPAAKNVEQSSRAAITVHAQADVNGTTFTVGDIADIVCKDAALRRELASVVIGPSPLPGLSRSLLAGDIIVHLRAHQINTRSLEIVCPPLIQIARASSEIAGDALVQAAIAAANPLLKNAPNVTLEALPQLTKITVPKGRVQFMPGEIRGQIENNVLTVPVRILVDGKPAGAADVTLHVHRKLTVVIARRTLEPHTVLTADDVTTDTRDLPPGLAQPIDSLTLAIGRRTTRRIFADAPLSANALEIAPDLIANARVTIQYLLGPVRITAPGLTRQAGKVGDTIRVYAPDTHQELEARIVDDHTVCIEDDGQPDDPANDETAVPDAQP